MGLRTLHGEWLKLQGVDATHTARLEIFKRALRDAEIMGVVHRNYQCAGSMLKPTIRSLLCSFVARLQTPPAPDRDAEKGRAADVEAAVRETIEKLRHFAHASDPDLRNVATACQTLHADSELVTLLSEVFDDLDPLVGNYIATACRMCVADYNRRGFAC